MSYTASGKVDVLFLKRKEGEEEKEEGRRERAGMSSEGREPALEQEFRLHRSNSSVWLQCKTLLCLKSTAEGAMLPCGCARSSKKT